MYNIVYSMMIPCDLIVVVAVFEAELLGDLLLRGLVRLDI